jgi:MinD superfamily P-loop ATPase containing an inserted ferredoxin domain
MRQLTVISGKGGTGKTSITASLAVLAKNVVVADCDVDAPDLHMLLPLKIHEKQLFKGPKMAVIDPSKCIKCYVCIKTCRFNAIKKELTVDNIGCEGCGVCALICPAGAITLKDRISGGAYISKIPQGFMSHALLNPGEANSGKLVTLVRQNAKNTAITEKIDLVIIDGSPGIGCPVIASITGVDATLVVTEPTVSGIHDLKRVLGLLSHFQITPYVCVNMYDINPSNTKQIQEFCRANSIAILGLIPYDKEVTEAMLNEKTIVEYNPENPVSREINHIWSKLTQVLEQKQ